MSFLLNLYKYREREKVNQLENYCTEALAYCLKNDKKLLKWFLSDFVQEVNDKQIFEIQTQQHFSEYGCVPDIVLSSDNTVILVECKVEANEGSGQLEKYQNLLFTKFENKGKYLVYLTRYKDKLPNRKVQKGINYKTCLWSILCNNIQAENDHFSKEFKKFIQGTIMKTITVVYENDIDILDKATNVFEGYEAFLNECKHEINHDYNLNFSNSKFTKWWFGYNNESGLIDECAESNFDCYLWFGIFSNKSGVVISVEIGIYEDQNPENVDKIIKLKNVIKKEINAEPYPDIYKNKNYTAFMFKKSLEDFKGENTAKVKEWFKEKIKSILELVIQCELQIAHA